MEDCWEGEGDREDEGEGEGGCCSLRTTFPDLGSAQPTAHAVTQAQQTGRDLQLLSSAKRQRRPKRATQDKSIVGHVGRELGKSELSWIWNWWRTEMATQRTTRSRIKRRSKEDVGLWSKAADLKHMKKAEQSQQLLLFGLSWPVQSSHLPSRIWEYRFKWPNMQMDIHKSLGQERMYPRTWREIVKVIARTALYLLQKGSRNQERILKSGNRQVLHACEHDGRSGELFADRPPLSFQRILEKTLMKTMCRHMDDNKAVGNSMDSQTTNCVWTVWVLALRTWLAWWMKEEVIYLGFCKACYMIFLQPNWWDMDLSSGLQGEHTIDCIMRLQELWPAVKRPTDKWFLVTSIRNQHQRWHSFMPSLQMWPVGWNTALSKFTDDTWLGEQLMCQSAGLPFRAFSTSWRINLAGTFLSSAQANVKFLIMQQDRLSINWLQSSTA